MLISAPKTVQKGNFQEISATVEFSDEKRKAPQKLWFRFPKDVPLSTEVDPFAVALLLLAMQNKEPLRLAGTLSQQLFDGMNAYQRIYHSWYPDRFHVVEIIPEGLRVEPPHRTESSGCALSGGVDSFYTFFSLLGQKKYSPQSPLTHAVFMAGFDMPTNLTWSISELTCSYAQMCKTLGIRFIAGSTNVRRFVNSVDWTNAHGQAIAATALFLKGSFGQFFIPSSYTKKSSPKWGTHPELDPLLSTASLKFVHHGTDKNRVDKLSFLCKRPETYDRLRVCWVQDIGLKNCGQCEKCVRTQAALKILGKLQHYSTFTHSPLTSAQIRQLPQRTYQGRLFAQELIQESLKRGKWKMSFDIAYSLVKRQIFQIKTKAPQLKEVFSSFK